MLRSTTSILRRLSSQTNSLSLRFYSTKQNQNLVLNAVGTDRTGIVSEVTKHVFDVGGNVGESQAAKLGNYFSIMMILQIPTNEIDNFKSSISKIEKLNTTIVEVSEDEALSSTTTKAAEGTIAHTGVVMVKGADQPGIVHNVTSLLASYGMSIESLKTNEDIAPHGGTTLFEMQCTTIAHKPIAKEFSLEKVRSELEDLGNSLNCDIILEEDIDDEEFDIRF